MSHRCRITGTNSLRQRHSNCILNKRQLLDLRAAQLYEAEKRRKAHREKLLQNARTAVALLDHFDSRDWEDEGTWVTGDIEMGVLEKALGGKEIVEISNAGGEFEELVRGHLQQGKPGKRKRQRDERKRRDIIAKRVAAFDVQKDDMVLAYLEWSSKQGLKRFGNENIPVYDDMIIDGEHCCWKLDTYGHEEMSIPLYSSTTSLGACAIRSGVIPCAPLNPSVDVWVEGGGDAEMISESTKEPPNPNVCEDRWKNMKNEKTSKMWGIFEETGIFLVVCRHGHVLMVMDMVRSGEQAKYPLAAVHALQNAFGKDLGIGYDIGCKFSKTLQKSQLGAKAKELGTTCLVGSFHGHAHNRICQLTNLA
ncbi:hypothetical protein CVT24_012964, partial [Panaeolus cyanescens]